MTKTDMLAPLVRRDGVADLHLVPGDHDPVDQQFYQLPPLLERGSLQAGRDTPAEVLGGRHQPGDLAEPVRLPAQLFLLPGEGFLPPLQVGPTALVLGQRDDVPQVGLGHALQLLGQAGPPAAQAVPPCLPLLR
jgi:hypothetical protein